MKKSITLLFIISFCLSCEHKDEYKVVRKRYMDLSGICEYSYYLNYNGYIYRTQDFCHFYNVGDSIFN